MTTKRIIDPFINKLDHEYLRRRSEVIKGHGFDSFVPSETIHAILAEWKIWHTTNPEHVVIRYETRMMGSGPTTYLRLGNTYFALVHNYDANPDGLNTFIMMVPLYTIADGAYEGSIRIFGYDDFDQNAIIAMQNSLINILTEQYKQA